MLYELDNTLKEIGLSDITPCRPTFGLVTLEELKAHLPALGFAESTVAECEGDDDSFRGALDIYDDYCFSVLNLINFNDIMGERDRIGFYFKKNLLLLVDVVDADKSTEAVFCDVVRQVRPGQMSMEKIIYMVLEHLLYGDCKEIEKMEFEIDRMENELEHHPDEKEFNSRLLRTKRKLLVLRNYYEQLIDIGEELQENDCDFFEEAHLRYFKLFTDKVTRLSNNVQLMRESVVQLREAYEATMDLNVNNLMKVFTVVSTIFLPLTLIVGWYGMNFTRMPELTWRWGYLGVIVLSVAVVLACVWYFKKKKLL